MRVKGRLPQDTSTVQGAVTRPDLPQAKGFSDVRVGGPSAFPGTDHPSNSQHRLTLDSDSGSRGRPAATPLADRGRGGESITGRRRLWVPPRRPEPPGRWPEEPATADNKAARQGSVGTPSHGGATNLIPKAVAGEGRDIDAILTRRPECTSNRTEFPQRTPATSSGARDTNE